VFKHVHIVRCFELNMLGINLSFLISDVLDCCFFVSVIICQLIPLRCTQGVTMRKNDILIVTP
jgi:hypothetical protein